MRTLGIELQGLTTVLLALALIDLHPDRVP
jgi:hypothetical protein